MAIQIQGNGGVVAEVDGTGFRALRVTARPIDYGALGRYRFHGLSGTMAAGMAAAGEIWQCRWTDSTRLALIHQLKLMGLAGSATAFTAGFGKVDAIIARAWSADGTGGTALTLTGNNNKLRTSMGTSLFGTIRMATTAALGAGTKTFDTQPIDGYSFTVGVVVSAQYVADIKLIDDSAENVHPVVLASNGGSTSEGVSVRVTVPATGTWQVGVTSEHSEVAAY